MAKAIKEYLDRTEYGQNTFGVLGEFGLRAETIVGREGEVRPLEAELNKLGVIVDKTKSLFTFEKGIKQISPSLLDKPICRNFE
ncbi:hypothetical protein [Candidatus Hecatella orcuttiae]|jgi:hypothetical protein|uniref:hypothetical protein n=1 Tax=Candidatus Hecatella orcuttiae TaxID=1935119 RepID=UPI0028681F13|nr:hypothetical protein [Candidatus Hecatella orcuttiae]